MKRYDLVVVGGGTAGLVSAQIAAGLGARVVLVERERTGGDCLWTGCVPSKALLAAAELAHRMRTAPTWGLPATEPQVDLAAVMAHVQRAQAAIEPQDSPERLRAAGVEVVEGDAAFTAADTLRVDGRDLRFRRAIVATGSSPAVPPIPGLAEAGPLTSDTVWDERELPGRLIVVGGGPIGCELGQAFRRLGSQVAIVETADRLLVKEEEAAGRLIAERLGREGIDLRLGVSLEEVRRGDDGGWVAVAGGDLLPFDRILVSTGRKPRTEGLGLDRAGVATDDRGAVEVDDRLRTANPRVFAAGDVVSGGLPFTHVAAYHARIATPNALLGLRRKADHGGIPWVTFTDPEVGRVGMTAAEARGKWGERATVADADYGDLDRAIAAGTPYGFARLVGDPKGRLVGATVAAPGGGEAIAELTAWLAQGAKIDAVSQTTHAYPTLAEGPARAADDHLRRKLLDPRLQAVVRPLLAVLRLVNR